MQIKCVSEKGTLLKISALEFLGKVLKTSGPVKEIVQRNAKEKMVKFILKSAIKYQSIKDVCSTKEILKAIKAYDKKQSRASSPAKSEGSDNQMFGDSKVRDFNEIIS